MFQYFKTILMVHLFFSFAITTIVYVLPDPTYIQIASPYTNLATKTESNDVASKIQGSFDEQFNLPIVNAAALVFYSGNIVLDLFLNFIFAIPEMISLLINGLLYFINIDAVLKQKVLLFATAFVAIMYILSLIAWVLNIRSSNQVVWNGKRNKLWRIPSFNKYTNQ